MDLMRTEKKNGFNIVRLSGRLDIVTIEEIEDRLNKMIADGEEKFIIDLGEVEYFSSSAMRVLISLKRQLDAKKGDLRLCNISRMVDKIMSALELMKVFNRFDSIDDALQG
jgi:anti-anti-sigma factor